MNNIIVIMLVLLDTVYNNNPISLLVRMPRRPTGRVARTPSSLHPVVGCDPGLDFPSYGNVKGQTTWINHGFRWF